MAEAQRLKAVQYRIEELLRFVEEGKIRIPAFQRGLRWNERDVIRLFDSLYRGYPVGTLLFWQRPAEAAEVRLGPVVVEAPKLDEASWVVDGQQRLTALAAALLPPASDGRATDNRFDISFDLDKGEFHRSRRNDPDTRLPVRGAFNLQGVMAWVRDRELDETHQQRAFELADKLRNYEIPAYKVAADDEQALVEIFDRTNTFGKRMTKAEVFKALNTSANPAADLASLAQEIEQQGFGKLEDNTLMYCVLATRQPDVLRDFRNEFRSDNEKIRAFQRTATAVGRMIDFLKQIADVPHLSLIPYQHQTVALVRFFALHPEPDPQSSTLLRRWFWRAAEVGPLPKRGNTGTLRAACTAITPDDAHLSVDSLLEQFEASRPDFKLDRYRWTASSTRTAVCALARRDPKNLHTAETVDVTGSIEVLARDALIPIIERSGSELDKSIANRLFVDPDATASDSEIVADLIQASDEIRASHLIFGDAAAALEAGEPARFLDLRHRAILGTTTEFLAARSEWDRETRPSVARLTHNA